MQAIIHNTKPGENQLIEFNDLLINCKEKKDARLVIANFDFKMCFSFRFCIQDITASMFFVVLVFWFFFPRRISLFCGSNTPGTEDFKTFISVCYRA